MGLFGKVKYEAEIGQEKGMCVVQCPKCGESVKFIHEDDVWVTQDRCRKAGNTKVFEVEEFVDCPKCGEEITLKIQEKIF